VTIDWFLNSDCSGSPQSNSGPLALDANGQLNGVAFSKGPLAAGLYGFKVHYLGDPNYHPSDGVCEPLRVVDANIQITPATADNPVGTNHTLTGHVNVNNGTGFVNAPNNTVINFAKQSGPGTFVGGVSTCTVTNGLGSCTVQITSASPGLTTVRATTDVTVQGVTLHRESGDGYANDSADAQKQWVGAKIAIAPDATNEVGQPHTFTVTVSRDTGGGYVASPPVHVTVTLTDSNGAANNVNAAASTCDDAGNNTDVNGKCTIVFTSPSPGKVTGHASANVPVDGTTTPVATDGTGDNSVDAVKTFVDANIQITPANATNPVNTNHTLTGHVNVNTGTGGYVNAPNNTVINYSIVSGPGSFVGGVNTCTVTNGLGSCTVDITSATPGTTVVRATTDVVVGGKTLHRASGDGLTGDGADAQKLWQFRDANIQISPLTATNEIGSPHVLTGHVNVNTGSGYVDAPAGTTINFTKLSGPGTLTPASCNTVGTTGTCTVTLTSSTAGVTTVQASTDVTVLGVVLHRETGDANAGDSASAQKTWVDANIQISPLTPTNEIGTPHSFTGHVNVNDGSGFANAPAGTTINFNIVSGPGILTPASCNTVGTTGECSVSLTSATAGVTTLKASTAVTVGGLVLNRATGDAHVGDSANAVKTWVDANIQITPQNATNPVTASHIFTGHVNVNTGTGGYVNAPDGTQITFSIVSGPGGFTTANPCTTAGGTGSCTITLTTATPGTTVVKAATAVTVGGVVLNRETGDSKVGDSGNATKLWADDAVTTDILNSSNQVVTSGTGGLVVHDKAYVNRLAGTPAAVPDPTGSVTFHRFTNANCSGASTDQTVALTPGSPSTAVSSNFTIAGSISYRADYLGDANYPARQGPCEPLTVILGPCTLGYPDSSHNPRSSAVFNESSVLRAFSVNGANGSTTTISAWYSDEHALTLGVDPDPDGTPVTPMVGTAAQHAVNPDIGDVTAADGAGRPMYPAAFVTDITSNVFSRVGDWQQTNDNNGAQGPQDLFGTWKDAIKSGGNITPGADPPKNSTYGPGADTAPANISYEGYRTEVRWNLASLKDENGTPVQVGHSYRVVFMVHDGDQNNAGGDTGEACVNLTVPTPPPPSPPAITSADSTTFTEGTLGNFNVTATGSPPPTFTETGALPSGVTLAADGTLSGTPASGTFGTYPITITATNGNAPDATQSFTLTVNPPPISGLKFNWISGGTNQGCTGPSGTSTVTVVCTIKNLGAGTAQGTVSFFNGATLPGIPAANNTGSTITIVPTVSGGSGTATTANIPNGSASSQTLSLTQVSTPTWTYSYTSGATTYRVQIKFS